LRTSAVISVGEGAHLAARVVERNDEMSMPLTSAFTAVRLEQRRARIHLNVQVHARRLASRAMICTISSRNVSLPPGTGATRAAPSAPPAPNRPIAGERKRRRDSIPS